MDTTATRDRVLEINELLAQEYGHKEWNPHRDPLSELVLTILSQHTSDVNSGRAFGKLRERFGTWEAVRDGDTGDVAEAIKGAGLGTIKAPRIREILQEITRRRGELDITFLAGLSPDEAKAWLRSLPGVGPKTAACVLLFSLQLPALPVDTHVHRVAKRLGLVGLKTSPERTEEELESLVPTDSVYDFHINLIEHGRRTCKAQRPRCDQCVLAHLCPRNGL